jgi:hypothetical protein
MIPGPQSCSFHVTFILLGHVICSSSPSSSIIIAVYFFSTVPTNTHNLMWLLDMVSEVGMVMN